MKQIAVVGSGKIGSMIADFLGRSGDYAVTIIDRSREQLDRLDTSVEVERVALNIASPNELTQTLAGAFAVLNAAPFYLNRHIVEAARNANAHYLDLTEDVASARYAKQ